MKISPWLFFNSSEPWNNYAGGQEVYGNRNIHLIHMESVNVVHWLTSKHWSIIHYCVFSFSFPCTHHATWRPSSLQPSLYCFLPKKREDVEGGRLIGILTKAWPSCPLICLPPQSVFLLIPCSIPSNLWSWPGSCCGSPGSLSFQSLLEFYGSCF